MLLSSDKNEEGMSQNDDENKENMSTNSKKLDLRRNKFGKRASMKGGSDASLNCISKRNSIIEAEDSRLRIVDREYD